MKYIDFHTHVENSNQDSIKIVSLTTQQVVSLQKDNIKLPDLFSVGIHSWYIPNDYKSEINKLINSIKDSKNLLAIGECGLDKICKINFDLQKEVFEQQINLSIEFSKPLIIHCVKSYNEILEYRKKYTNSISWIIHGFYGSLQLANQLISHGFYLSIGSKLIKPSLKSGFKLFYEENKNKILLESDTANQIERIYREISDLVSISVEEIKSQQYKNFENIFGVKL